LPSVKRGSAGANSRGFLGEEVVPRLTHLNQPHQSAIQLTRLASNVILAFRTFETGQPALALLASSSNFARSAPGTFAFSVRCTAVIANPSATLSSVTSAFVSMFSAVNFASPRISDRAMVKQPACAAPISSSGLVPGLPSKRLLNPYG